MILYDHVWYSICWSLEHGELLRQRQRRGAETPTQIGSSSTFSTVSWQLSESFGLHGLPGTVPSKSFVDGHIDMFSRIYPDFLRFSCVCQSVPPSRPPSLGTWRCSEHNRHKIHKNISTTFKDSKPYRKRKKRSTKSQQRNKEECESVHKIRRDWKTSMLYLFTCVWLSKTERKTQQNQPWVRTPCAACRTLCAIHAGGMHDMLITSVESDSAQTISNGLKRLLFDTSVILTKPNPIKAYKTNDTFLPVPEVVVSPPSASGLIAFSRLPTPKASPDFARLLFRSVQTQCSQNLPTKPRSLSMSEYVWVRCCQKTSLHSSPWPQLSSWATPFLNTGPEPSKVTALASFPWKGNWVLMMLKVLAKSVKNCSINSNRMDCYVKKCWLKI